MLLGHILLCVTLRRAQTLTVIKRVPISSEALLLVWMVVGLHVVLRLWMELLLKLLLLLLLLWILHHHVLSLWILAAM